MKVDMEDGVKLATTLPTFDETAGDGAEVNAGDAWEVFQSTQPS